MRNIWLSIIFVCLLITVGCTLGQTDNGGENMYPFTGIETTEEVTNRPVAVMVSNQVPARPQTGLSKADIVMEMLTEGNVTRFMAIYQSNPPEVVGPVRSAREYFVDLAHQYDSIYVYQGAAGFVNDLIKEKGVDYLEGAKYDDDGELFVRETFRETPHNSYLQFDAVYDVAKQEGYDIEQDIEALPFLDEGEQVEGEEADYVKIDYYGGVPIVEYEYDTSINKYVRTSDNEPTVELESEKPLEIDNVFIIEAEHEVIDDELRRAIDIESGGKGYLLQQGKVQYVDWENRDGRIVPMKDGEVIPFVPGQTWINFVQKDPEPGVKEQVQIENKDE